MEARGYTGGPGRTHYFRLRFGRTDVVALAIIGVLLVGLFAAPFGALDQHGLALLARLARP